MRRGRIIWVLLCLLCVAGAWFFWHQKNGRDGSPSRPHEAVAPAGRPYLAPKVASHGAINTNVLQISRVEWGTNKFAGRLSNTTRPIGRLVNDSHAILLANALIDTTGPLNFVFPKNLQPQGDPGAYIVQARGPLDQPFRAMLAQMGAAIVSYIPNDAYLVRASSSVADMLQANSLVQAVVPYEPYYKIQSGLLYPAVNQIQLADGEALNLGLFADGAANTLQEIPKLGGQIIGTDQSPFGPVVRVIPPKNWTVLATLPGVQIVEPFRSRAAANDLSRAADGVAADSLTATNYLGLTGSNIIVEVNDTGIDAQHPDFQSSAQYNRALPAVIGDSPQSLVDTDGHGTHVAGIIAGDGAESMTVTNAPGSTLPGGTGTNYQFRGMAPGATLYSVAGIEGGAEAGSNFISDQYLQETPALTNALICNNSWVYDGDSFYDLAAASYDAAVRDALSTVTGSQPVLFVFAAGNAGNGNDNQDQGGGAADSIESPATAKDVISVGAIQEQRNITNVVQTVTLNSDGTTTTNTGQPWQAETSTDYRVAGFSSRGNTGIGIEGTYGRYKPDVVAPGTFTISTRSGEWDINSYFYQDPTNDLSETFSDLVVQPGSSFNNSFPNVPSNAVQVAIYVYPGADSPVPFPDLPIFVGLSTTPGYDFIGANDPLLIPGDPNAPGNYLQEIINSEVMNPFVGFYYAISNNTVSPISFSLETDLFTTNGTGNYFLVLSNLDNSIGTWNNSPVTGPYYRYESGTSMSAADVSGVLALMQQFYFNAYGATPSPAMLKAMLINGAQPTSSAYNYLVQNSLNFEGWGLVNLPGSLPTGITNQLGVSCSTYIQDQSPTNALATGDSQTFYVNMSSAAPLRATLAWTDPPGDPAAAIKLVNNLVLVVTNFNNPTNPIIYYGNDFPAGDYNNAHATNTAPVYDSINNVQNVNLQQGAGTNYSVTVLGYRVNVNAVTAQTNTYAVNGPPGTYAPNVVQDFALVISSGATNDMTVSSTPAPSTQPPATISNPTGDQNVTDVSQTQVGSGNSATTYAILQNQFVGANSPLLGNNTILFPPGTNGFGPNNWQVTVGQTNQWHFYVVTNANNYSNAAFIVFNPNAPEPDTLSVPRMGVFADTTANSSRDADIDLYVSTDPSLTNLNPMAISNAVVLGQVGGPAGANFAGASLGRGSSEFVADTNAQSRTPGVYYVGVKSEDQESAEYGFIAIFTQTPFSQMQNGNQVVNGVPVPADIPDGSSKVPGKAYIFGLALFPMQVAEVTVANEIWHQNFGDLIGTLTLSDGHADVLNNHDSFGSPPAPPGFGLIYDDSAGGGIPGSRPSDGPGSLIDYIGQQAMGVWMLTEADTALTQTGTVYSYELTIQPHQDLGAGVGFSNIPPQTFKQIDYIDVPPGATNLIVTATNYPPVDAGHPLELFVQYGLEPTTNSFLQEALINQPDPITGGLWGSLTYGPPLKSGRYFVGVYNPSPTISASGIVFARYNPNPPVAPLTIYNSTDTPKPILDDAVTTDSIFVTNYAIISSLDVALAVQHPRISDLVFHLISPDGTRELLMENRGGTDPNGAGGITMIVTNTLLTNDFDAVGAGDYNINQSVAGWNVAGGEVSVETDPANAYGGKNNYLALGNGTLSTNLATTPGVTYTLTFAYRGPGIVGWWRGEGNANDSAYGNNGTMVGPSSEAYYTNNGEVGSAFTINEPSFNPYAGVDVPDSPAYVLTNSLSIEGWIRPSGDGWIIFWRGDNRPGYDPYWLGMQESTQIGFGIGDNAGGGASIFYTGVPYHTWHHVAATLNGSTGSMKLYVDGNPVAQTNTTERPFGQLIPFDHPGVGIGNLNDGQNNFGYYGDIDEMSLYNRALSASEIQAIFSDGQGLNPKGGTGKFDPNVFNTNALQSLAEAQVSVNGSITNTIFGNNTNWQARTITFTATSSQTPVQITGIEPGMLLGSASVTAVTTNYAYLVFTENTNNTTTPIKFAIPPFVSGTNSPFWQNGFEQGSVGMQTTPLAGSYFAAGWHVDSGSVDVLSGFYGSTAYEGSYYIDLDGNTPGQISTNIPTVAGQTYRLGFAYTKNASAFTPPIVNVFVNSNLLATLTANIANSWPNLMWQPTSFVFTATSPSTHLAFQSGDPGSEASGALLDAVTLTALSSNLYYLPEQSLDDAFDGENAFGLWTLEIQDDRAGATNPLPVLENWQLRFNFVTYGTNIYPAVPLTLPQLPEQIAIANQPFTVTNAAYGGAPPYAYTLTSTVTNGPTPAIDTNGVITWTPNANQASAVYIFTNIVTDSTGLTATDIFPVLVVLNIGQPAFPGAEGPGGAAIGGRGGDVYHVINVNDGGPGSLRYGITNTSGNRTIVFDVGGTINLQTNLVINDPYLTIAGQTAPGDGITLNGFTASLQDAHDDVLRFLRFRPGDINSPAFQGDSFHFLRVTNSIVDHISASWSINEALSTTYSTNISVQWSIIADPLNHSAHYMDTLAPGFETHGYGSLLRYGSGAIGYHHDLYADNYSYNPRPGDNIQLDFVNNVVFNWGIAAGINADDSANNPNGFTNFLNYIGNYFIAGGNTTANPNIAFQANVPNAADTQIYQSTNFIDNNASTNLLNGTDTGFGMFSGAFTQLGAATPMPGIPITSTNPPQAYEQVLAFAGNTVAGASTAGDYLLRDTVDTNIVAGVRDKSGRIIDFISSNRFSGVYLNSSSESTYSGFTGAGTYWQSQGVTNFVGVNPWPVLDSAPQPLDSDGDGIPDYWEITEAALGQASMNPAVPNNNHLNPDGYTDLEHYINWLAAPHALTVSNTPVNVDLDAIVGRTGTWGFGVTNAINGTVTLTNYTATFTPTNGVIGFASFDFIATNLVTSNDFAVTVSVFVSVTNITYSSVVLSNAKSASNSATNTVPANSIFYYLVKVPTNAVVATNRLLSATGPVNLLFSGVGFPTGTNIGDYTLLTGSTVGSSVLSTTSVPTNIVQGGTYYLGVQNASGTPVTVGVEVDFSLLQTSISGPTITSTNINGTNGFLLRWSGPTNYDYTIQWKTNLTAAIPWNTVVNPVINATFTPAGGYYSWFDDGTLAGGFPPIKFYRVVAGTISGPITTSSPTVTNVTAPGTITPLTVSVPANATIATNILISATGPINVWFSQTTPFTGGTNAGDVLMLSGVTGGSFLLNGSSTPPLVPGANYYLGLQNTGAVDVTSVFQVTFAYAPPPPSNAPTFTTITLTNIGGTNGILLTWFAPTNYRYQVQWTTNLLPGSWQTIPGVVLTNLSTFAPTNGIGEFQYLDDGTWTGGFGVQKFYRLIAWPPGTTIPPSLVITSVKAVPGGVQIQWGGSTNYVYDMAWTTNLGLPTASWNVISNLNAPILIYSGGVFTYSTTNVLTPEFFRVLLLP